VLCKADEDQRHPVLSSSTRLTDAPKIGDRHEVRLTSVSQLNMHNDRQIQSS
jgi:hypothetical protein